MLLTFVVINIAQTPIAPDDGPCAFNYVLSTLTSYCPPHLKQWIAPVSSARKMSGAPSKLGHLVG